MADHCIICHEDFSSPSAGGPGICPSCDCGVPPEVKRLRRENARLRMENLRLKHPELSAAQVSLPEEPADAS